MVANVSNKAKSTLGCHVFTTLCHTTRSFILLDTEQVLCSWLQEELFDFKNLKTCF